MVRCKAADCRRWWSQDWNGNPALCGCGGELEVVDMAEHFKTLPSAQPEKPPAKE